MSLSSDEPVADVKMQNGRLAVYDAERFVMRAEMSGLKIPFLVDVAGRTLRVIGFGPGWLDVEPE